MAATVEGWAKEATLKRAPLASVRHAAVHRVHPRFSHSCTHGAVEPYVGIPESGPARPCGPMEGKPVSRPLQANFVLISNDFGAIPGSCVSF